jgi:hypothetical protein
VAAGCSSDSIVMNAMSLSPQGLREVPVVRRRQRSRPAALHHPWPERVNPVASRFYCGPGNVGREPHADGGRDGCVDSAGRRRARSPVASSWSTRQYNSAGRDRNGHRSAPGPGSGHTRTSGPRPASAIPGKRRRRGRREARRMRDGRYTARHAIRRLPITQTVGGLGTGAAPASLCRVTTAPRLLVSSATRSLSAEAGRCATRGQLRAPPRLPAVVGKHRLPPSVSK